MQKSARQHLLRSLYGLHIMNDGFRESIVLLFPFMAIELGLSLSQVGLLGTSLHVIGIVSVFPATRFAAKRGALRALLIAAAIYGLAFLGLSGAQNLAMILPFVAMAGIGFGAFHPLGFALVARLTQDTSRGKAMGDFTAIGDIGRIGLSVLVTFLIASIGWRETSLIYGLLALAMSAGLVMFIKTQGASNSTKNMAVTNTCLFDK